MSGESWGRVNCGVDVSWNMLIAIVDNYPTEIELLLAICKFLQYFLYDFINSFIFLVNSTRNCYCVTAMWNVDEIL